MKLYKKIRLIAGMRCPDFEGLATGQTFKAIQNFLASRSPYDELRWSGSRSWAQEGLGKPTPLAAEVKNVLRFCP
jgi:hypothetical protein